MRYIHFTALVIVVTLTAFQQKDPMAVLQRARAKFNDCATISYQYSYLWPNPAGIVDTASAECSFAKTKGAFEYDYVARCAPYDDIVFIGGQLSQVSRSEKKVILFPYDDSKQVRRHVLDNIPVKYSPLTLIGMAWSYAKDTVIEKIRLSDYRFVERDTIYNGKHVMVELHLFVNTVTSLPERYERRSLLEGKSQQTVIFLYSKYKLDKKGGTLTYTPPAGFRTEIFGQGEKLRELKVGEPAPLFSTVDINGKPVKLEDFRGKKVLLDFSTINCGYCKQALDHMTQDNFNFPAHLVGLYINPTDKKDAIARYSEKVTIPFMVVPDAREIGKQYGVYGYPTFYVIDEQGLIEKVVVGYEKEFIDGLAVK